MTEPMRVLFLAAEADPLIKVGGLGDVAGSLPQALLNLPPTGNADQPLDIRLVLPFHSAIRRKVDRMEKIAGYAVPYAGGAIEAEVFQTNIDNLIVYLIAGAPFSDGEPVYTSDSMRDGVKYTFFSLAALALPHHIAWMPDVIHGNDWHTAVALYAARYSPDFYQFHSTPSVLTIHNLPFMGSGAQPALADFGISPSTDPQLPEWARLIPLPMGLSAADRILAVSQSYAQEIQTPAFGCGLETFLQSRRETISGILNGLDQEQWDPATDRALAQNFDSLSLESRRKNRAALLQEVGLPDQPDAPLFIMITRMDSQKGIDLALESLYQVSRHPWQAIILGTGDALLEAACAQLQESFPERVRAILKFDALLARRMYAGGDMILMPSRYEPCGLAQMISMHYGCVPIARATGGLKDTIRDVHQPEATGFLFQEISSPALSLKIEEALLTFSDPAAWQKIQQRGMHIDFSWQRSAAAYAKIYSSLKEQRI